MFFGKIKQGELLFNESDVSNSYFILERGMLEVMINGKVYKIIKKKRVRVKRY